MDTNNQQKYAYTPLEKPLPIREQEWPDDTLPLVQTRVMAFMHEPFIRDCIEGILMQKTTFPTSILIHDDASTDKTAEIVQEYATKYPKLIKAYFQQENTYSIKDKAERRRRRAHFQNLRTGKYEAKCEGDDYWTDPLKLQKQVTLLENHPDLSCCVGGYIYNSCSKSKKTNILIKETKNHLNKNGFIFSNDDMKYRWLMKSMTLVYRKSVLENNQFKKYKNNRDIHLFYHLLKNGKGFYFSEIFGVYNAHKGGIFSQRQGRVNKNATYQSYKELFHENKDEYTRFKYFRSTMSLLCYDLYNHYEGNTLRKKTTLVLNGIKLIRSLEEIKIFASSFISQSLKDKIKNKRFFLK